MSVAPAGDSYREVRYSHSDGFPEWLGRLGGCLLISTYQAGKLVVVGTHQGKLAVGLTNFEQAMGIAIGADRLTVGSRGRFWHLRRAAGIGPRIQPLGKHDECFATRSCQVTGPINSHEMCWIGDELWIANTLFSCLCTLSDQYSFVPRWRPAFISALAAEDRCHLNGMATDCERIRYVTTLGESDLREGWRENKVRGGCLIDVMADAIMLRGLCMPHSPRLHGRRLWLLDSGRGMLCTVELSGGRLIDVAALPGYTRGLGVFQGTAFIGLSKIRETNTFGGVPIADRREQLVCGVGIVDLSSGRQLAAFQFLEGVDEIFDVQFLPGIRFPAIVGPYAQEEGQPATWVVASPNADRAG